MRKKKKLNTWSSRFTGNSFGEFPLLLFIYFDEQTKQTSMGRIKQLIHTLLVQRSEFQKRKNEEHKRNDEQIVVAPFNTQNIFSTSTVRTMGERINVQYWKLSTAGAIAFGHFVLFVTTKRIDFTTEQCIQCLRIISVFGRFYLVRNAVHIQIGEESVCVCVRCSNQMISHLTYYPILSLSQHSACESENKGTNVRVVAK